MIIKIILIILAVAVAPWIIQLLFVLLFGLFDGITGLDTYYKITGRNKPEE